MANANEVVARRHWPSALRVENVGEPNRLEINPALPRSLAHLVPLDPFERICRRADVGIESQESEHLFRRKSDIGIDEQKMGRVRREELADHVGAGARDQSFPGAKIEIDFDAALKTASLQREDGVDVRDSRLPAVAGSR